MFSFLNFVQLIVSHHQVKFLVGKLNNYYQKKKKKEHLI